MIFWNTEVFQNEAGVFHYDYPLKMGKNKLVIKVQGANGKALS